MVPKGSNGQKYCCKIEQCDSQRYLERSNYTYNNVNEIYSYTAAVAVRMRAKVERATSDSGTTNERATVASK